MATSLEVVAHWKLILLIGLEVTVVVFARVQSLPCSGLVTLLDLLAWAVGVE